MATERPRKPRLNVVGVTMDHEMLSEVDAIVTSYASDMSRATVLRGLIRRGLRARAAAVASGVAAEI